MRRLGHAGKVDANHQEIVLALRKGGATVLSLAALGHGVPDLLVSYRNGARRDLVLVEIKTAKGTQTTQQREFEALGWEVVIVRSPAEALQVIGR